jgi:hypothetical protein
LVAGICCLAVLSQAVVAGGAVVGVPDPWRKSDPDSTGSLPKTVGPTSPTNPTGLHYSDIAAPTPGLVLDAPTRQPVVGVTVVVTNSIGQIVAVDVTDALGEFEVYLFSEPGLELAVPTEGVVGVPIVAGDPLVVLVY